MGKETAKNKHLRTGEFYSDVVGKFVGERFELTELVQPECVGNPQHIHESAYFSLLLEGTYSEYFRNRAFNYGLNTIVWHPPSIDHADAVGRDGARFFMVEVKSTLLDRLREFSEIPTDVILSKGNLSWLGMRLFDEFRLTDAASPLAIEGLVLEMLAAATREKGFPDRAVPKWLTRTKERLTDEFGDTPSIEELAVEAGVHPAHLSSVFRKVYGTTPGGYVRERRISEARKLLSDRDFTLSDIALRLGFSDQSHFTRVFKKMTGVPPGTFRRENG